MSGEEGQKLKERLQKILAARGVASRRMSEKLIESGIVMVNGVVATLGQSADPEEDIITVDGEVLDTTPELKYIVLYKPRGVVTTMKDELGRKTAWDLVSDCGTRVYPTGRLDLNSEGLLIMTNDGAVAHAIMHPSTELEKAYRATVKGTDQAKIEALTEIRDLDGEPISQAQVTVIKKEADRSSLEIIIHEGKNRQIRRMCEEVGLDVLRLKRNRVGEITLGFLKPGEWRNMETAEVKYLKSIRTVGKKR